MARRINLLPPSERRRTQTDVGLLLSVVVAMMAIGIMGMTYFHSSGQLADKQAELAQLQTQNRQLQTQLTALAPYRTLEEQKKQAELVAQHVYEHRTLVSEVMGDISLVVPENVWFSKLTVQAPAIPGTGVTSGASGAAPGAAATVASTAPAPRAGVAGAPEAAGKLSIAAATHTFEDVSRFLVRLQQVPSLKEITLSKAETEDANVKNTTVEASVINAQPLNSPLPIAFLEVQGQ